MLRLRNQSEIFDRFRWFAIVSMVLIMLVAGPATQLSAQSDEDKPKRPETEELLPETTVAFVEIGDIREFLEKSQQSNGGKLMENEKIANLTSELWNEANSAFDRFASQNEVELTLEQLTSLPGGEINVAVIAPKRKKPVFLFTFEYDEENENVDHVINVIRGQAEKEGSTFEDSTVEEVEFHTIVEGSDRVTYFQKDGVLVGSNSEEELTAYLDRWMGREVEKTRPLSKNRKFVTIMNRCRGTRDLKPDMRFYVDPIELARSSFRGNMGAQTALNFLPVLGLDGLLGVGGSVLMFEDEFESVSHAHILLANPRKGIFEMIALKPSSYEPDPWIPDNAVNYMSTSWDVKQMYHELAKMIDTFQGEDATKNGIEENINQELDIDFEEDVLGSFTGRITWAQFVTDAPWVTAQKNILGFELTDDNKIEELVEKIMARIQEDDEDQDNIEEREYKGFRYWVMPDERVERQNQRIREEMERNRERGEFAMNIEAPQPCVALIDRYVVFCPQGSPEFIEKAIDTFRGELPALKDDEKFVSIAEKISRLAGSDLPSAVMYSQPEDAMRNLLDAATDDDVMNFVQQGRDNEWAGGFVRAIEENPLPEFDEIKHLFSPSGGFVLDDETGYHFLMFQTRANESEDK